jgi:hypothetical protein
LSWQSKVDEYLFPGARIYFFGHTDEQRIPVAGFANSGIGVQHSLYICAYPPLILNIGGME